MFGKVVIPSAVASELLAGVSDHPEIDAILHAAWLEVRTLNHPAQLGDLPFKLDAGEEAAIQLAMEMQADHILMDEARGRKVASAKGLSVIGVLGVLVRARSLGLIGPLRPIFTRLTEELNFRVSPEIITLLLEAHPE
ncbi:MAG: DUF3368 domain-containing protein [Prosthecobacter sp.]|jgi:predicted nucleic acid-binding protein|nr:DUF3368 domain-containing protein [Prosthecobacter sp.]